MKKGAFALGRSQDDSIELLLFADRTDGETALGLWLDNVSVPAAGSYETISSTGLLPKNGELFWAGDGISKDLGRW